MNVGNYKVSHIFFIQLEWHKGEPCANSYALIEYLGTKREINIVYVWVSNRHLCYCERNPKTLKIGSVPFYCFWYSSAQQIFSMHPLLCTSTVLGTSAVSEDKP